MEIRDQCIQHLETISGINEYLGIVTAGLYHALLVRCALHGTATGGTHADHTPTIFLCLIDGVRRFFRHLIILRMHMMLQYVLFLYRSESSQSHMQCHISDLNAFVRNLLQQFLRKMQSRRRCCCGAFIFGINGLITILILQLMGYVRRQGHLSQLVQHFFKNTLIFKTYQTITFFHSLQDFCL